MFSSPDAPVPAPIYEPFINCSSQLEAALARPGQQVLWLLMSDSLWLRRDLQQRFGTKLLTLVDDSAGKVRTAETCGRGQGCCQA